MCVRESNVIDSSRQRSPLPWALCLQGTPLNCSPPVLPPWGKELGPPRVHIPCSWVPGIVGFLVQRAQTHFQAFNQCLCSQGWALLPCYAYLCPSGGQWIAFAVGKRDRTGTCWLKCPHRAPHCACWS